MPRIWDQAYEIVEGLRAVRTVDEVREGLRRGGAVFGYENFFMTVLPDRPGEHLGAYALLSGWPEEWLARYVDEGFVHVDPVVHRLRRDTSPFMWSDAPYRADDAAAARVMNESPDFGLVCGMSVPIHGIHGQQSAACFSSPHRTHWSGQRLVALQLIAIFAHARTSAILDEGGGSGRPRPRLSRREIEVMKWSSAGKSAWDISEILDLSESTVREYLGSAQRKLRAVNRTHAVAEALRHGLVQ